MPLNYYDLLDIPYNATPQEIREAYFRLARSLHPDVNPDEGANESFIEVKQAYEILSSPDKKAAYDASIPEELRRGPDISINAQFSMSAIPLMNEPQLVYALVELICKADLGENNLPPLHVCLVLDRSTSMQGQRMDMVKSGALNLLQQLRPQDFLSVVSFSDRAEVIIPPTRASAISKSDHRVSLLQTGGGTEILQGLNLGMEQLRMTDSACMRQLILLTDGHTYGDEAGCLELAKEAASEGISISVMGIGHDWNDEFMDKISALSGGNTLLINSSGDLDNFLMGKLAEIGSVYARSLLFEYESAPEVKVRYAFRLTPNIGPLDTACPMLLGNIQYRRSISFLMEILVPAMTTETDRLSLASGKIWMEIPGWSTPRTRISLDINRPVKLNPAREAPPPVIVEAMSKLTLYRLQEKVRQEVGAGQIDKATRHLHYLATHLLSQGDRELAHMVLLEAEHIQQSRRFSGEGEKRIKYGTRALLLPPGPELKT